MTVTAIECPEWHEGRNGLERALKAFEGSHHKAYRHFYTLVTFISYLDKTSLRRPALDAQALDLFTKSLGDGSILPEDQNDIAERMIHGWAYGFYVRNAPALISAIKQAGADYEWRALVLDGEYQIDEAWRARGSGYADIVSQTGWKEFGRHLKIARTDLNSAWKAHPE